MNCSTCRNPIGDKAQAGVCSIKCFIAFYSHRTPENCWIPIRPIEWDGRVYRPHHISYVVFNGKVPKGRRVIRTCQTRCCISPLHLSVSKGKSIPDQMHSEINVVRATLKWLKDTFFKVLFRHRNI